MSTTAQDISTKLVTETAKGNLIKVPVTLRYVDGRIEFVKSPFALKNEIKAMAGSRWHGYIEGDKRKIWSVADCPRNRFQLGYLQGENVYGWFDRELVRREYERSLMPHQCDMADAGLTYHFQIWAAEMGTGKTLSAQEVMERSGARHWYWIGPKTSLPNIRREFRKWNMDPTIRVEMMTYEALVRKVDDWKADDELPRGVIFDESSKLKTPTSQRSKAALRFADMIRAEHGFDGYVILMSGTPSPKSPIDWWSQAEIAWPGFLREGSVKALEQRLAFMADKQFDAGVFKKRIVREVPCPKTKALKALLEENEEVGRIVIFAGFTGSVDRVTGICRKDGWDVVRCDGRGFQVTTHDGHVITDVDPLDYWADVENNPRVAFVAHPESGGMSLTLVEARTAVYWSNSFKPEYRAQSEDRIHRKGMDENLGCTIVDLVHLPTDERVLEVIRDNRRLELMTMGDFSDALQEDAADESEAMEVVDGPSRTDDCVQSATVGTVSDPVGCGGEANHVH